MDFQISLKRCLWFASLCALATVAGPLAFHPALHSSLTKRLTHDWRVRLDELSVTFNGYPLIAADSYLDAHLSQRIVVTDTYGLIMNGQPAALDREFNVIHQVLEVFTNLWSGHTWDCIVGTSDLELAGVQFRLEDGAYTKAFQPIDQYLDWDLLAGLTEDMDLRVLLPADVISVGDSWDIDLAALSDLLSPGGYFAWNADLSSVIGTLADTLDPALMGDLRHVLAASLEGTATVMYMGDEDGFAELEVTLCVETNERLVDLTGMASKILSIERDWDFITVDRLALGLALEASGTARWDLAAGHIHDLELAGELGSTMELDLSIAFSDGWLIEIKTETSAEFVQRVEVL